MEYDHYFILAFPSFLRHNPDAGLSKAAQNSRKRKIMSDGITSSSSPDQDTIYPQGETSSLSGTTSRITQRIVLISICLGWFMASLDNTIVNVALRSIGENLQTNVTGLQWVVDSYALVYASILLTAGALGDRLGNKQMYLTGLLIFSVASALCGFAPTLWGLLVARIVQGLGAALMTPNTLALISKNFPNPVARVKAIAIWATTGAVALTLGPMIGGFLIGSLSWRSIFFINVPIGIIAFVMTWRLVAATSAPLGKRHLDLVAQVTIILALSALTFALIEGSGRGWLSPFILCDMALFVVAGGIFILVELRSHAPMLPLNLFLLPTFSATTVVGLILNFGYYGFIFLLSLFFEQVRGYTPLITGLALFPMTASIIIGNIIAGRLTGRFGPRLPLSLGFAGCSVGLLALGFIIATAPYLTFFYILLITGFGMGLAVPPLNSALLGTVSHERSGVASGMLNASRQVGGVIGVAIFGSLIQANGSFVSGLHLSAIIAGCAMVLGCIITWYAVDTLS
jgi:DHA2 family methylenomycin A resistance protein-like MFS transporter